MDAGWACQEHLARVGSHASATPLCAANTPPLPATDRRSAAHGPTEWPTEEAYAGRAPAWPGGAATFVAPGAGEYRDSAADRFV